MAKKKSALERGAEALGELLLWWLKNKKELRKKFNKWKLKLSYWILKDYLEISSYCFAKGKLKMKTKFQKNCDKVIGKPCLNCGEKIEIPFFLDKRVFCRYVCSQEYQYKHQILPKEEKNIYGLPEDLV